MKDMPDTKTNGAQSRRYVRHEKVTIGHLADSDGSSLVYDVTSDRFSLKPAKGRSTAVTKNKVADIVGDAAFSFVDDTARSVYEKSIGDVEAVAEPSDKPVPVAKSASTAADKQDSVVAGSDTKNDGDDSEDKDDNSVPRPLEFGDSLPAPSSVASAIDEVVAPDEGNDNASKKSHDEPDVEGDTAEKDEPSDDNDAVPSPYVDDIDDVVPADAVPYRNDRVSAEIAERVPMVEGDTDTADAPDEAAPVTDTAVDGDDNASDETVDSSIADTSKPHDEEEESTPDASAAETADIADAHDGEDALFNQPLPPYPPYETAPEPHAGYSQGQQVQGGAQTAQYAPVPTASDTRKNRIGLKAFGFGCLGTVATCAVLFAGLGFAAHQTGVLDRILHPTVITSVESSDSGADTPDSAGIAESVAEKAMPSVVSITTYDGSSTGTGSGCVIDDGGHILTNAHVLDGATDIVVSLDGKNYDAEIVGEDDSSDLAVIRIDCDADELSPIAFGDSDDLSVGQFVMAIGSPFGNEQSVSVGVISSLDRSTARQSMDGTTIYADLIQTDAAINPGNSGGALVDENGNLIGINSLLESYSGSSSGVGFAIPSNYAKSIAEQLIDDGEASHPYLGATVSTIDPITALRNKLNVTSGAVVEEIENGSAADKCGLREDDVITAVDGEAVTSADELVVTLRSYNVGDDITLTVVRDGKEMSVDATLGSDTDSKTEQGQVVERGENENDSTGDDEILSLEDAKKEIERLFGRNGSK